MKRFIALVFVVFSVVGSIAAQDTATVIAIKANVRGTPDAKGIVVFTINRGESYEVLSQKGAWFLVQTATHVGWVHGNSLELDNESTSDVDTYTPTTIYEQRPVTPQRPVPRTTVIQEDDGKSPFQEEYVGGTACTIEIKNDSGKELTLLFGGVKYTIGAFTSRTLEVDPGTYDFRASAPGVRELLGSKGFRRGYIYKWSFYIVTRRV